MKKLADLIDTNLDISITGITDDSRNVSNGYIFVATRGYYNDHFNFIEDAINRGCSYIICDREISYNIPHLVVDNINEYYIDLCKKYFDVDVNKMHFIGITGTDGKTTTTSIVKEIIKDAAYLGTNGLVVGKTEYSTNNTTPCVSELYRDLQIIQDKKCCTVAMEVSSEALLHGRVNGIFFDIIGFTNITEEHLNVHKSFDDYVKCKLRLLNYVNNGGYVVVNGDDSNLVKIKCNNLLSFGFNKNNDYIIENVIDNNKYVEIFLSYNGFNWKIVSSLKGKYNVYNVVMAFIIGRLYGIKDSLILRRIKTISSIKGRREYLDFGQKFDIILDYAHTINGISSILDSVSNYSNIIVVTGCAGGREVEKRPKIGDIIFEKSDVQIFTMDDPRFENVDDIIDQMVGSHKGYFRIIDREEAIQYALSIASENSVVLILGKGRDEYMAINDKKIYYSDYEVIYNYFNHD